MGELARIVIDNGSWTCQAGWSQIEDVAPPQNIRTVIGHPTSEGLLSGVEYNDLYVGATACANTDKLNLRYPMKRGIIQNWLDMEDLWHHMFHDVVNADPTQHGVLLTETPLNPKSNREQMTEIMFETFGTPWLHVSTHSECSLYAKGVLDAVVMDVGHGATTVLPVYDGFALRHATRRTNVGGGDLTDYMMKLLSERGYSIASAAGREIATGLKENLGFVSLNYDYDLETASSNAELEQIYRLPDGTEISIASERFRCAEPLFRPYIIDKEIQGIHEILHESLNCCPIDCRWNLQHHICVAGGCTAFRGFSERLSAEVTRLSPKYRISDYHRPRIILGSTSDVWLGGAILASLYGFKGWVAMGDYNEIGPTVGNTYHEY